jgi:hypothetical protein
MSHELRMMQLDAARTASRMMAGEDVALEMLGSAAVFAEHLRDRRYGDVMSIDAREIGTVWVRWGDGTELAYPTILARPKAAQLFRAIARGEIRHA